MNALSTITVLPSTKAQITDYVEQVKAEIASLPAEELPGIWRQLKAFSTIVKEIEKDESIKNAVIEAVSEHGKTIEINGAKITIKTLTKWDYSECNDPKLNDLTAKADQIKETIAARQKMLQSITGAVQDGEVTIYPARCIKDETIAVTIK